MCFLGKIFHSKFITQRGLFFLCFWLNVYQSTLVAKTTPPPPHTHTHTSPPHLLSGIILFGILNTSVLITAHSDHVLCTASGTFRIVAYSELCFSGMYCHIQSYSASLRHIHAYWDIRLYSQPCYILSPGMFRTGYLFKTLWNVD